MSEITKILDAIQSGRTEAADDLLPLIYDELRRLAAFKMAGESPDHTLQPTALVHEAWLRLVGEERDTFSDRQHFFNVAAEAMRRVLVDRARRKLAHKRGGQQERLDIDDVDIATPDKDDRLLALDEALDKLALEHPEKAKLVKLRYFGGLKNAEVVSLLGISEPTAKRWWAFARAWLHDEIKE